MAEKRVAPFRPMNQPKAFTALPAVNDVAFVSEKASPNMRPSISKILVVGTVGFGSYNHARMELDGMDESTMRRKEPSTNTAKNSRYTSLRA